MKEKQSAKKIRPDTHKHWEIGYSEWSPSRNMIITEGADFNAKCPKDRKTTYVKVNEQDH